MLRAINWNVSKRLHFDTVGGTGICLPDDFGKELRKDATNGFEIGHVDLQKLLTDYSDDFWQVGN